MTTGVFEQEKAWHVPGGNEAAPPAALAGIKKPGNVGKRCSFEGCGRPDQSSNFYLIKEGKDAGGKDWSPVYGQTLCHTCYRRFLKTGSLDKPHKSVLKGEKRCTYEKCLRPTQSSQFYLIEEGRKSGGKDWSPLVGWVLCGACYCQYNSKGTLERSISISQAAPTKRSAKIKDEGPMRCPPIHFSSN
jgi:hypothetical protein